MDGLDVGCFPGQPINPVDAGVTDEKFVSLTTFKKSGEAVAAPVWIVADGDRLVVWTPSDDTGSTASSTTS